MTVGDLQTRHFLFLINLLDLMCCSASLVTHIMNEDVFWVVILTACIWSNLAFVIYFYAQEVSALHRAMRIVQGFLVMAEKGMISLPYEDDQKED